MQKQLQEIIASSITNNLPYLSAYHNLAGWLCFHQRKSHSYFTHTLHKCNLRVPRCAKTNFPICQKSLDCNTHPSRSAPKPGTSGHKFTYFRVTLMISPLLLLPDCWFSCDRLGWRGNSGKIVVISGIKRVFYDLMGLHEEMLACPWIN